jgi:DNA-binding NarL/FixJ family response regulator
MTESPEERARRALESMRGGRSGRIRVLLADDHQLLRQAMRVMLEMQEQIEVIAEASDGREAVDVTDRLKPDVVLMDLAMPGLNGVEATSQIVKQNPRTKVLIVTGYVDDQRVLAALRAGAHGYVVKRSDINELLLAIQAVNLGNPYFSQSLAHGRSPVEYLLQARGEGPADSLSPREREVLQLVAEGYTNQEIADRLVVSVKTVEAHKAHIMAKLKAQNRTDLIKYAIRQGIISLGDDDQLLPGENAP